jgi:nicotinamidase-related amidase
MLVVVDVQNGFLNEHTHHVLANVGRLVAAWRAHAAPVAFTRFVNREGGPHVRWIGWTRFMNEPENALVPGLDAREGEIVVKHVYSAFTEAFERRVRELRVGRLVLCGIATDGCVLKTAVDAFEREIEPVVAVDACASHAGARIHEAGLELLARFIGRRQLRSVETIVAGLAGDAPPSTGAQA